jgi:GNAT superfamily N-acetyltransferase
MDAKRINIRRAEPKNATECGRVCYEAFREISAKHDFPPDFPDANIARVLLSAMFAHPRFYCVIAEENAKIIGSNCLDERNVIAGIGPITIDPQAQNRNVGRMLMKAVMDRTAEKGFAGVPLVQAAFHNRSLSLYAKLGFDVREPLAVMQGPALKINIEG